MFHYSKVRVETCAYGSCLKRFSRGLPVPSFIARSVHFITPSYSDDKQLIRHCLRIDLNYDDVIKVYVTHQTHRQNFPTINPTAQPTNKLFCLFQRGNFCSMNVYYEVSQQGKHLREKSFSKPMYIHVSRPRLFQRHVPHVILEQVDEWKVASKKKNTKSFKNFSKFLFNLSNLKRKVSHRYHQRYLIQLLRKFSRLEFPSVIKLLSRVL